jgi:hypothetical protein
VLPNKALELTGFQLEVSWLAALSFAKAAVDPTDTLSPDCGARSSMPDRSADLPAPLWCHRRPGSLRGPKQPGSQPDFRSRSAFGEHSVYECSNAAAAFGFRTVSTFRGWAHGHRISSRRAVLASGKIWRRSISSIRTAKHRGRSGYSWCAPANAALAAMTPSQRTGG